MPFDSKEFVETKPEVLSLEGLVAWLETQDPATTYNFKDCDGACLIDTYLTAVGASGVHHYIQMTHYRDGSGPAVRKPADYVARAQPWTYGDALARARKILASP